MENSNPFGIFKRYKTTLKDKDIEIAYLNRKTLVLPFSIFNACFYLLFIFVILNLLKLLLGYFKILKLRNELYWLFADMIVMIFMKILHLTGQKLPKNHNIIGCVGIIVIFFYVIECYIYVDPDPIYVFIKYKYIFIYIYIYIAFFLLNWRLS